MPKVTIVLTALAIALVPAGVAQAGSAGKSKGKGHAYGHSKADKKKGHAKGKAHHRVAYRVRGTVTAFDATAMTITVKVDDKKGATNRRARDWRGKEITFDVSHARLTVRDFNGDGKRNFADVAVGDRAKVLAKLPRSLEGVDKPYRAKKVTIRRPSA